MSNTGSETALINITFSNDHLDSNNNLFLLQVFKDHPLKMAQSGLSDLQTLANVLLNSSTNITFSTISTILNATTKPYSSRIKKEAKGMPNTALLSFVLLTGTFLIAFFLRKLRHSHFFSSKWRRIVSDFGVPLALFVMVGVNFSIKDVYTQKINIPRTLRPTKPERHGFFVNPLGVNKRLDIGYILLGIIPAILVSILIFMETELTGVLLNKKRNKLRKGGGYNMDLFMMGVLTGVSSILGLPWMCAATVRSVQHVNALVIMSRCHAPGERPHLVEIKEQRLTNFLMHILVGE